jgi:hypothetical protein
MKKTRLIDSYAFPGFRPVRTLIEGDTSKRIVVLQRQKKAYVPFVRMGNRHDTIISFVPSAIYHAEGMMSTSVSNIIGYSASTADR